VHTSRNTIAGVSAAPTYVVPLYTLTGSVIWRAHDLGSAPGARNLSERGIPCPFPSHRVGSGAVPGDAVSRGQRQFFGREFGAPPAGFEPALTAPEAAGKPWPVQGKYRVVRRFGPRMVQVLWIRRASSSRTTGACLGWDGPVCMVRTMVIDRWLSASLTSNRPRGQVTASAVPIGFKLQRAWSLIERSSIQAEVTVLQHLAPLPPGRSSQHVRRPLMPKYSAYLAVVGHPLMITLIVCYIARTVCYVARMVIFVAASIAAIRSTNNRHKTCLKLVEMTCRRWTWQHPPSKSSK
jgi:hypothetical protein